MTQKEMAELLFADRVESVTLSPVIPWHIMEDMPEAQNNSNLDPNWEDES